MSKLTPTHVRKHPRIYVQDHVLPGSQPVFMHLSCVVNRKEKQETDTQDMHGGTCTGREECSSVGKGSTSASSDRGREADLETTIERPFGGPEGVPKGALHRPNPWKSSPRGHHDHTYYLLFHLRAATPRAGLGPLAGYLCLRARATPRPGLGRLVFCPVPS